MDNVTRWNFRVLGKALKTRRVVIISGARQCGKSTLLEMFFDGKVEIRSLDSKRLREAALLDPQSFVRYDGDGPMVIDEVQKAPELLSEIKLVVDRNRRPGQYVITGSSDIYSAPETDESLAGRVKNIRMRTFAQGEIQGVEPTFLDRLFANDYDSLYPDCDKRTVLDLAFRGGYPEVVRLSPEDRREWFQDYVKSLFSKDIKDDERIRRQRALYDLLKAVAAWSSKYIDSGALQSACGLSRSTYREYLGVLERYYLCESVEAWTGSDYARIGKRPKWYMCDTGLMAAMLNWRTKDIELDADKTGKIVETLVFTELAAQIDLSGEYSLYQYRDIDKREVDFIVEDADGNLAGVEVKAGAGVGKNDFRHLEWFREHLTKGRRFVGIVLYSGSETLSFGNGMLAVPMSVLWS